MLVNIAEEAGTCELKTVDYKQEVESPSPTVKGLVIDHRDLISAYTAKGIKKFEIVKPDAVAKVDTDKWVSLEDTSVVAVALGMLMRVHKDPYDNIMASTKGGKKHAVAKAVIKKTDFVLVPATTKIVTIETDTQHKSTNVIVHVKDKAVGLSHDGSSALFWYVKTSDDVKECNCNMKMQQVDVGVKVGDIDQTVVVKIPSIVPSKKIPIGVELVVFAETQAFTSSSSSSNARKRAFDLV